VSSPFVVIWSYVVEADHAEAFERAYGENGDWARLFRSSPDFLGTELLHGEDGSFVTIDRWSSAQAYDAFLAGHAAEYRKIDEACDELTTSERRIGRYVVSKSPPCTLRLVAEDDLPVFFEHQRDREAAQMAAFPSRGRDAFMAHWRDKVLGNPANLARTIVVEGSVAGNIVSWAHEGRRLVGYWIGREHWGKGTATGALTAFLRTETTRPLYAWVAEANVASVRVLKKCGFLPHGEPHTGDDGVVELLFKLDDG
jgi:RimJ/RimL family protein N-acetyltransferase/heme-degrading monooxygenase HmoA